MASQAKERRTQDTGPDTDEVLTADVLVIGGGLVGGTLACGLAQHGISVLVAERDDPAGWMSNAYDGRASAVALGCQKVLDALGIWRHMGEACQPIDDIRIADKNAPLSMHYHRHEAGDEPMGYMAENLVTRRAIQTRLGELEHATLLAPVEVIGTTRDAHGVEATLADGRRLRARLLVAADGRRSPTRETAGIGTKGWRYNQDAIVVTVEHEAPHNGTAIEHFLPAGPFATLPLTGNRSSIVWCETPAWTKDLIALPDDRFKAEFMARFGDHFGDVRFVGPRFSYPLSLQVADRYTDHRLVLVGDAAHGMHPVAGQGMNYGLRDVAVLVEELVRAHRLGLDVGAPDVLRRYGQLRPVDNAVMLAATDGIVRLFSNDWQPLRLARTAGLAVVDKMGPLKKLFMRHAMGTVGVIGGVPRLMQGRAL
ncbi:UbiH/UbiF/VisC/COQ6 family ubiquinone biosynthesis hydroxylase [Roseospira navarrensis]|nr:UbiH/UbiF/VisC/COQ6 family ubiquinone biosynthesis hydroxylase [Roseospira navarrensis]